MSDFDKVRERLKNDLEESSQRDVGERRRKRRKTVIRLLFIGLRIEEGERRYHYADITKVFNHGMPLDEEAVKIRKYRRTLDRAKPGSISEYEYEIGPLGELQLLPKTRIWRGNWQNMDDILRWQAISAVNASKHRAKTQPGYNQKIFGQRMQVLRAIYVRLTPMDRLLFLSRIIYHVTAGRNESVKEDFFEDDEE